jgi:hypothetical protein
LAEDDSDSDRELTEEEERHVRKVTEVMNSVLREHRVSDIKHFTPGLQYTLEFKDVRGRTLPLHGTTHLWLCIFGYHTAPQNIPRYVLHQKVVGRVDYPTGLVQGETAVRYVAERLNISKEKALKKLKGVKVGDVDDFYQSLLKGYQQYYPTSAHQIYCTS